MTHQDLFKALNLTPHPGHNFATIAPGVSLHLHALAGQVLWVIVDDYKTQAAAWVDLDENTITTLSAVIAGDRSKS